MSTRVIYAFDVGGIGNFGWARLDPMDMNCTVGDQEIAHLAESMTNDARQGRSIALGVEAPCFIPVPRSAQELNHARTGEGNRAWCAPAGACVTTIGLHQLTWVLRYLRDEFGKTHHLTMDWSLWPGSNRPVLLLWEAFVTGDAAAGSLDGHVRDAATAVHEFCVNEGHLGEINAVTCFPRICLAQAAALWAGWSSDISALHDSMLVVRPNAIWQGEIQPWEPLMQQGE